MERPQHDHLKATADEPHQPAYPLPTPWLWGGVDVVAVDVDDDLLQAVQFAYDPGDAHPGGVLEVAGYGQGGHHHRQVSPGGIAGVVEDGAGSQVVLAHTERLLHVPHRGRRRRPRRRPSGG